MLEKDINAYWKVIEDYFFVAKIVRVEGLEERYLELINYNSMNEALKESVIRIKSYIDMLQRYIKNIENVYSPFMEEKSDKVRKITDLESGDFFWEVVVDKTFKYKLTRTQIFKVEYHYGKKVLIVKSEDGEYVVKNIKCCYACYNDALEYMLLKINEYIDNLNMYISHLTKDASYNKNTKTLYMMSMED